MAEHDQSYKLLFSHPEMVEDLLRGFVKEPEQSELARAFTVWLRRVVLPKKAPGVEIPEMQNLQEAQVMLAERVKDWSTEWVDLGRQEGRQEGEAAVLRRQMELKFGPLSEAQDERLAAADAETLLEWSARVLTASRAEDVLT